MRSARTANVTTKTLPAILEFCREERVKFLIARSDAADLPAARAMYGAGFDLMDTLIYVERSLTLPPPVSTGETAVRLATADDLPIIRAIAEESFAGYVGHYHADPRLDPAKCDAVYVSWALRCFWKEAADVTFIGEVDGQVAGFLSACRGEPATAPITGIRSALRRRGVYRALVGESVRWCTAEGSRRMMVSTQVRNLVSLNTWLGAGFRTCGVAYTFHKWFDG